MCIIRQLMYKHSIIDSYPMMLDKIRREQEDDDPTLGDEDYTEHTDYTENSDNTSVSSQADEPQESLPPIDSDEINVETLISEKIARDVLIFKKIAERLPPTSLLHLLNADVLVSVNADDPSSSKATLTSAKTIEAKEQKEKESQEHKNNLSTPAFAAPFRASKVKFAVDSTGKILCRTKVVKGVSDKSLWWQRHEMETIRAEATALVEHYVNNVRDFERDLTNAMEQANERNICEPDDRELAIFRMHGDARGLERHIVLEFNAAKQAHYDAVMIAQEEYRLRGTTERWRHLKKVSLAHSMSCRYIAVRCAQSDEEIMLGKVTPVAAVAGVPNKPIVSSTLKAASAPAKALRRFVRRTFSNRSITD